MKKIIFGSFFLLVIFLRFYSLTSLPNGLYWDEMDGGYQAYSLLLTGRDYYGSPLPLFPHSLADYRAPVFIYSLVPFVKFLSLTPLSVRFPSALWGMLALPAMYVLGSRLFSSPKVGIFSAIVLGFSLWHIQFSRQAQEPVAMFTILIVAAGAFLTGLKKPRWLIISGIFFALSLASYSTAKLFVPLFILSLIMIYRNKLSAINIKWLFLSSLLCVLLSFPLLWSSTFGPAGARFHDISIFTDPTTSVRVDWQRRLSQVSVLKVMQVGLRPGMLEKLLYNKYLSVAQTFLGNYLSAFSPQFLFVSGDPNLRHSPGINIIGQLQLIEIIPLVFGLAALVLNYNRSSTRLLLVWLLLAPIPAALTRDGSLHAARLLLLLPPLMLIISLGWQKIYSRNFIFSALLVLYFLSLSQTYYYYFHTYRIDSAAVSNYGFSAVVQAAISASPFYDHVYIDMHSEWALMAYLFTQKISPRVFQSMQPLHPPETAPGRYAVNFGKLYFLEPGETDWTQVTSSQLPGKNLVIAASDLPSVNRLPALQIIQSPAFTPAFYIFEQNR